MNQALKFYLLPNNIGPGFYGKIKPNRVISEKEFMQDMCEVDHDLDLEIIRKVLGALQKTGQKVTREGSAVSINGFMRIYPKIKGTFENPLDGFDRSRHSVQLACNISSVYSKKFENNVTLEKIKRPKIVPDIDMIEDNKTKNNLIHKNHGNRIMGDCFIISGYKFDGIELIDTGDTAVKEFIGLDKLEIMTHKSRELLFTIDREYTPPEWLIDEKEIFFTLRFLREEEIDLDSKYRVSEIFTTMWKMK